MAWESLTLTSAALICLVHSELAIVSSVKAHLYNILSGGSMMLFLLCGTCLRYDSQLTYALLCGVVKRATFVWHGWLIDAMSAPIIVSSLLHSATLVLALVCVCYKCGLSMHINWPLVWLSLSRLWLMLTVVTIGSADMKWVLAYSTGAHISLMCKLGCKIDAM